MSRYIDADKLVDRLKSLHNWCRDERKKGLEQSICIVHEQQPTADVVEVVRCKDCHFWQGEWHDPIINLLWGECHQARDDRGDYYETAANDYCSYGERREEDEG